MINTQAAYFTAPDGPLDPDRDFYDSVANSERTAADKFEIPVVSGLAWTVKAGQVFRLSTVNGPQVGDLNLWNLHNPREHMWASRTRQLQRAHVSVYDRLWSRLPYLRPLVTICADTLQHYGCDAEGGRVHDLLGSRCDPYVNQMLTAEVFDFHCHSNLTRAVLPHGLNESDIHDVLNVFQCTGLNDDDQYFMKACPAQPGDYIEFFAEQDLLCALSTCPGGDLALPMWGPGAASETELSEHRHPIGVEVYDINPAVLANWCEPACAQYAGMHGLTAPNLIDR